MPLTDEASRALQKALQGRCQPVALGVRVHSLHCSSSSSSFHCELTLTARWRDSGMAHDPDILALRSARRPGFTSGVSVARPPSGVWPTFMSKEIDAGILTGAPPTLSFAHALAVHSVEEQLQSGASPTCYLSPNDPPGYVRTEQRYRVELAHGHARAHAPGIHAAGALATIRGPAGRRPSITVCLRLPRDGHRRLVSPSTLPGSCPGAVAVAGMGVPAERCSASEAAPVLGPLPFELDAGALLKGWQPLGRAHCHSERDAQTGVSTCTVTLPEIALGSTAGADGSTSDESAGEDPDDGSGAGAGAGVGAGAGAGGGDAEDAWTRASAAAQVIPFSLATLLSFASLAVPAEDLMGRIGIVGLALLVALASDRSQLHRMAVRPRTSGDGMAGALAVYRAISLVLMLLAGVGGALSASVHHGADWGAWGDALFRRQTDAPIAVALVSAWLLLQLWMAAVAMARCRCCHRCCRSSSRCCRTPPLVPSVKGSLPTGATSATDPNEAFEHEGGVHHGGAEAGHEGSTCQAKDHAHDRSAPWGHGALGSGYQRLGAKRAGFDV